MVDLIRLVLVKERRKASDVDQILKWATMIVVVAITGHLTIEHVLVSGVAESKNDNSRLELEARAPSTSHKNASVGAENDDPLPGRAVRVKAGRNGHFYLDARINGINTPFVVDTGASVVALSFESARKAGIKPKKSDFIHPVSTANGVAHAAATNISSVRYQNINVRDVRAVVLPKGALGGANLLGNSFLSKLSEFKVRNGTLVMVP